MNKSLFDKIIRKPYPLDQFPMLPCMAGDEVLTKVQPPDSLIGMMMISAMSIACQPLIDVRLPTGAVRGTNQYLLMAFDSGEGKTTVYDIYFEPFKHADIKAKEKFESLLEQHEVNIQTWTVMYKVKESAIKKAGKGESTSELEAQLADHIRLKPKKPILRQILYSDISLTAMMEAIQGNGVSIAHFTDEGEMGFESELMLKPGMTNRLWDSQEYISRDRGNHKHIGSMNPRVANHIMTQHVPLKKFLAKHGLSAKECGQMARFLIGSGNSKKGYRKIQPTEKDWYWIKKFNARSSELLERYMTMIESGKVEREILEFTDDAKVRWFDLAQQTENQLLQGQYLYDIADFASKMMDITARLAATMHYFSGERSKITRDTLERAFNIVLWHLDEYKYLFSSDFMMPQDEVDAYAEAGWLLKNRWGGIYSDSRVTRRDWLKNGDTRIANRLNAALPFLVADGAVQLIGGMSTSDPNAEFRLMNHYFANLKL